MKNALFINGVIPEQKISYERNKSIESSKQLSSSKTLERVNSGLIKPVHPGRKIEKKSPKLKMLHDVVGSGGLILPYQQAIPKTSKA